MKLSPHDYAVILNVISLLVFLLGLVFTFSGRKKRFSRRILWLTAAEMVAIFLAEWAVAKETSGSGSTLFIDTMQAFSLDSSYDAMTTPLSLFRLSWLNDFFHYFRILLYSLAPVVGGAIIYDVLAGVSPEIHLFFVRFSRLYVFSELNEKTVTLAESLYREIHSGATLFRPHLVFTDCYSAGEEEDSELLQRAKAIRAVCLKDDLLHCDRLKDSVHCCFFLMDQGPDGALDDLSNVGALRGLLDADPHSWKEKRGCTVYLFSNSSEAIENVRSVKAHYDQVASQKAGPVKVHVIRDYAQACYYHLKQHPLFEGLKPGDTLDLMILGWTPFAREMFKAIFWSGQMLDHPLRITVVTQPSGSGEGKTTPELDLERSCPELLASCREQDPCLSVFEDDSFFSAPYASLCFLEEDLRAETMRDFLTRERFCGFGETGSSFSLANVNRCFVMAGKDEENIALADELRRALVYLQTEGTASGGMRVDLLVENPDMHRVIQRRFRSDRKGGSCVRAPEMLLFGSLASRYLWSFVSVDGAFVAEQSGPGAETADRHGLRDISASRDDIYNDWSRVARAFHMPVKMFCIGAQGEDDLQKKLDYQRLMQPLDKEEVDRLRWLEHRRWCAFLRSEGFSAPPKLDQMVKKAAQIPEADLKTLQAFCKDKNANALPSGLEDRIEESSGLRLRDWRSLRIYSHKDVPSRLHPCLVECLDYNNDPFRIPDLLDLVDRLRTVVRAGEKLYSVRKDAPAAEQTLSQRMRAILQNLTSKLLPSGSKKAEKPFPHLELPIPPGDLKKYDSPYGEFGPTLSRAETFLLLRGRPLPGVRGAAELAWNELLRSYPDLERCQRSPGSKRYCVDLLLDYREKKGQRRSEEEK